MGDGESGPHGRDYGGARLKLSSLAGFEPGFRRSWNSVFLTDDVPRLSLGSRLVLSNHHTWVTLPTQVRAPQFVRQTAWHAFTSVTLPYRASSTLVTPGTRISSLPHSSCGRSGYSRLAGSSTTAGYSTTNSCNPFAGATLYPRHSPPAPGNQERLGWYCHQADVVNGDISAGLRTAGWKNLCGTMLCACGVLHTKFVLKVHQVQWKQLSVFSEQSAVLQENNHETKTARSS